MSLEQNKAITRRIFEELWNGKNPAVIDELVASDYQGHTPNQDLKGADGYRAFYNAYVTAFPDCHLAIGDSIAEGDTVVTPYVFKGTHQGDLMGIPPTGKQVAVEGVAFSRYSGGKLAEGRLLWDSLGLMQQLGIVPQPGA